MSIFDRFQSAIQTFRTTNNSMGENLGRNFLKYGNKKIMQQDWSKVLVDDKELYTGYPYAAIDRRANKVAHLAKYNLKTTAAKAVMEDAKKKEEIIEHPYLSVIDKSKRFANKKFWYDISTFLDLEGVYYLMAVRTVASDSLGNPRVGNIQEFRLLNPYNIRRILNKDTLEVGGYVETRNGMVREIPVPMIIEMRKLNPFSDEDPFAMVDAAKTAQFTLKQGGDYTRHSLKNNMAAPGVISSDVILEPQQFENFVDRIINQEKGVPLFGNGSGAVSWQDMQIDMDKAALKDINEINRQELFAVSGAGKTMLSIEESGTTRDTAEIQGDLFVEYHAAPQAEIILDALNQDYKIYYEKDYEKNKYALTIENPLGTDYDDEIKAIEKRDAEYKLYDSLIAMGYKRELASKYAEGKITIEELGDPTEESRPNPLLEAAKLKMEKDSKSKEENPKDEKKSKQESELEELSKNLDLVDKIVDFIENRGYNPNRDPDGKFGTRPSGSSKGGGSKGKGKSGSSPKGIDEALAAIEKSNKIIDKATSNSEVGELVINEFDEESQGLVQQQQAAIQNSIIDVEGRVVNSIINNIFNNTATNDFNEESDVMSEQEKKEYIAELALVLGTFYGVLFPLFATSSMASRLKEFNLSGTFKLNAEVKKYIKETSNKAAESHITTILEDVRGTVNDQYKLEINRQVKIIEDTGRAVTDEDLVLARKRALEGASRERISNEIKKEFNQKISDVRAKAISRTETNRAFTQSQYQADIQFIQQNNLEGKAYKQWVTRSDEPCPICQSLAAQAPIPFEDNFASLGDELTATFTDNNGKTRVQKIIVGFEDLGAGNAHVNCACRYKLVIRETASNKTSLETFQINKNENKKEVNDLKQKIKDLESRFDKRTKEFKELNSKYREEKADDKAYIKALEKHLRLEDE